MVRLPRSKVTNENLIFIESLMLFDLWLTIKIHWLMAKFFRFVFPIVKIALIMLFGILVMLVVQEESNVAQITADEKSNSIMSRFSKPVGKPVTDLKMCNNYIYQYSKDRILPDFAAEASGALIIGTPDTKTYNEPKSLQLTMFGLPVWKAGYYTPRKVIQPWTEAGECWAFDGSHGKIEIEMAYEIVVEKVTLEHIPASAALTGRIDSAPKSFKVWGKVDDEYVAIGSFTYDDKGLFSQTFEIKNEEIMPFKIVMLEILSNYGHPTYTCVYRFRIHGKIYSLHEEQGNID